MQQETGVASWIGLAALLLPWLAWLGLLCHLAFGSLYHAPRPGRRFPPLSGADRQWLRQLRVRWDA